MVIWPQCVSTQDGGWIKTKALLQVLALDPRKPSPRGYSAQRAYFETADDFLIRPLVVVDAKRSIRTPAAYYSYSLRFNVSASVHGHIPIDAADQLAEFKSSVNAALRGPLTVAERKGWEADREFRRCYAARDTVMADRYRNITVDEFQIAHRNYHLVREAIETSRRGAAYTASSLCSHDEVIDGLIQCGQTCLVQAV